MAIAQQTAGHWTLVSNAIKDHMPFWQFWDRHFFFSPSPVFLLSPDASSSRTSQTSTKRDGGSATFLDALYRSFSERLVLWKSVIVSRKSLLVAIFVFCYSLGTYSQQVMSVVLVLIFAFYEQMACRSSSSELDILDEMESA